LRGRSALSGMCSEMSQSLHEPRVYERGIRDRLVEGFRYRGGVGQWSWLLHRVTGLGILLFLVVHIIDTFLVVAFPAEYDFTVAIYGGTFAGAYYWPLRWLFRLSELGLIASVLFHALNGMRIVLFDFWPSASNYQKPLYRVVQIVFWITMLFVTIWVIRPLFSVPQHAQSLTTASVGASGTNR